RGVRVGIIDLVRNEVFSRIEDTQEALRVYQNVWQPFEESFRGRAEEFFFPYALLHDSNTKKSEIFSQLRRLWDELSPAQIVEHMVPYRQPFLAIDAGRHDYPAELGLAIDRLNGLKRPSAVYPFVMGLLRSVDAGDV